MPAEFDFARNIKEIERLKTGLVAGCAQVFEVMNQPQGGDGLPEALAEVMACATALARRLGVREDILHATVRRKLYEEP